MAQWKKVATNQEITSGQGKQIQIDGHNIALFNVGGKYYAIHDECTHAGGSLAEGSLEGNIVACPWHGATFDVTCGKVLSDPAYEDVRSYPVKVEGAEILIEI